MKKETFGWLGLVLTCFILVSGIYYGIGFAPRILDYLTNNPLIFIAIVAVILGTWVWVIQFEEIT